VQGERGVEKQ
jgi:hypothetical protein